MKHRRKFVPINTYALKTICGGILFDVVRYNKKEIWAGHLSQLTTHLHLSKTTLYGIDVSIDGFVFFTQHLSMRYRHDDYSHERRTIDILHRTH